MLKGLQGPINGKHYGEGIMMPLEEYKDQQIADVLTYIRRTWRRKGKRSNISPENVAEVREKIKDRKTLWTLDELQDFFK